MKLPPFFLALLIPALQAAETREDHFRLGESALADQLWGVAALHFGELLRAKNLPPEEKNRAAIRFAESLVRDSRHQEALSLLDESFIATSPEASFWRGQALAGLGRIEDALRQLATADPMHEVEAAHSRAALFLRLNQPDEALSALDPLARHADPFVAATAALRRTAILFDQKRFEEARRILPKPEEVPAKFRPEAMFLDAELLLAEGNAPDASLRFSQLLTDPTYQSLERHHAAAIGFGDSLAAQDSPQRASESLLSFIQENPDSPLLGVMFGRLLQWLPAEPSPNHPTLDRLTAWSEPANAPKTWLQPADFDALFPEISGNDRLVHALYARGIGLYRVADPAYRKAADHLLLRVVYEYPDHSLATAAMLEIARRSIADDRPIPATAFLDALREHPSASTHAGEAGFLKAQAAYEAGDFAGASQLFAEASKSLSGISSDASLVNSAVSRFRDDSVFTIATGAPPAKTESPELQADLELERALTTTPASAARTAIEDFLTRHPKHPRVPEARLAAAENALAVQPPDLSQAKAQLDTIASDPVAAAAVPSDRLALTRLRLTELSGDSVATITAAKDFLAAYPDSPNAPDASLTLGLALFQSESFNDARLVLEQLARKAEPSRAQAAWLLAARAASLVGTPQSRDEALILFDNALAQKGTLDPIIQMEKADLLIRTNRFAEAADYARKWYKSLPPSDPLRIPAGLLFGQAVTPQGTKNSALISEALAIYDELLKHPDTQPALVNRIQYLRGMALEQLPSEKNPDVKREGEAVDAYYSVLYNSPNPPAEWEYLERSGFRALDILVKAEKWPSAIAIAKKIAEFKGPNAADAEKRARDIQLKTFTWDD